MSRHHAALSPALLVASLVAISTTSVAWADLPPPPGQTHVDYSFEVDADVEGSAVVAFPSYGGGDASNVQVMEARKPLRPVKGWTPGIYLLPKADVAGVPKGDQDAAKAYLESHGKVCVKQVPRIYRIATETNVDKAHDVIHIESKGAACEASLIKTLYTAPDGRKAEGGADAKGQRNAPAPFDKGLPSVSEAGFVGAAGKASSDVVPSAAPSSAPASSASSAAPSPSSGSPAAKPGVDPPPQGCASCTLAEPAPPDIWRGAGAALAGVALALAVARRRRTKR